MCSLVSCKSLQSVPGLPWGLLPVGHANNCSPRKHCSQIPKSPQVVPFNVEEWQHYCDPSPKCPGWHAWWLQYWGKKCSGNSTSQPCVRFVCMQNKWKMKKNLLQTGFFFSYTFAASFHPSLKDELTESFLLQTHWLPTHTASTVITEAFHRAAFERQAPTLYDHTSPS